jgi:diguanylate cyclase (GGDEF)-like protein/PAS domain S-box-containing protein
MKLRKTRAKPDPRAREGEERLNSLIALSSDWYWEQDENYRFTLFIGTAIDKTGLDSQRMLGTFRWDGGALPLGDGGSWDAHLATLAARQPFFDFIYYRADARHGPRYISASGQPVFDARGRFKGYRGIAKNVTERVQNERRLAVEHAVARLLADSNSIAEAAPPILRAIGEAFGWAGGARLTPGAAGALACAETWCGSVAAESLFVAMQRAPARYALPGNGAPVWLADLAQADDFPYAAEALKAGLPAVFAFPIKAGAQTAAVFAFFSTRIDKPDPELLRCAVDIGAQIGQFWQRTCAEEQLREIGERFQHMTELSSDWYWELDENHRFVLDTGNEHYRAAMTTNDALGKQLWDLPFVDVSDAQWASIKEAFAARRPFRDEVLKRKAGVSVRYVNLSGRPFFDDNGRFKGYRGIGKDITEQKLAEERIHYVANHDSLTALPNRVMFSEILNHTLHSARRYNRRFAVLFIDLDRFKNINDTFGHDTGDALLKEMGRRLTQTLRVSDVVARLGGDEFVVLLQEAGDEKALSATARKILSALSKPVTLLGQECRVTASIGICTFPDDAQDEQSLMKNADIAMYRAKDEGKNTFKFYSEQINNHSLERLALETSLRRALERNEFFLHYQAKLDLTSGDITGAEALLRWQHPDLGVVSPAQFIPLAEETGLIVPIGKWVLSRACAQAVAWQRQGMAPMCMAVNLSPRQFADDDLVQDIAHILAESGLDPTLLELEITESMVMQNPERAIRLLTAIKSMGVRLAIDDFGTGYSSLAQIKRFPIDTLKVDRSFIRDIPQNTEDNGITEAIIAMAKTLSLTVVAEGVETKEQQSFLREHACDEMQGYYFSKPITAELFFELVKEHLHTTPSD